MGIVGEALTRSRAEALASDILDIHSLIPGVDCWTTEDLLADKHAQRIFPQKWELSVALYDREKSVPIGFIISYFRLASEFHPLDSVYIHRFALSRRYQNQGIGSAALRSYAERLFSAIPWLQNITVQTNTSPSNDWVVQFYEKNSFRKICDVLYKFKRDWLLGLVRADSRYVDFGKVFYTSLKHPRLTEDAREKTIIYISTTNVKKFAEISSIFTDFNIEAKQVKSPPNELIEPQIERSDPEIEKELVRHPLRLAARFLEVGTTLPFVVEDTALYIEHFNGNFYSAELPGYDTKRWWRQLGTTGLLKLMEGSARRRAKYVSQFGCYIRGGQYVVGRGETLGSIAFESRVSGECMRWVPRTSPWFFHSVFIPDGSNLTFGEMNPREFAMFDYKRKAILDFAPRLNFPRANQLRLALEP